MVDKLSKVFAALADPVRRDLVARLAAGDSTVSQLAAPHDITVQAWSPFQGGFFTGVFLGSPDYLELNEVIDRLAEHYDVPAMAIATAWITRHPANMQVVLGTTTPSRVTDAAMGSDIPLTRAEWYELFRAAGYRVP